MKVFDFTKPKLINLVLWIAFLLALVSSVSHLAWAFGTLEKSDRTWAGWIPAIAVDAGLAALAYSIQQRKRAGRPTKNLWWGVAAFALISALANLLHALSVEGSRITTLASLASVDVLQLAIAIVLSATLPGMVVYLGEVVSSDDAAAVQEQQTEKNKAEQAEKRRIDREEREQRRLERETENEAKRLELEQQNILFDQQRLLLDQQRQRETTQADQEQHAGQVYCKRCDRWFKNRQAYAAHGCNKPAASSNGKHGEIDTEAFLRP